MFSSSLANTLDSSLISSAKGFLFVKVNPTNAYIRHFIPRFAPIRHDSTRTLSEQITARDKLSA